MHRVNRCTIAGTVWAPTSANRALAHCYPLPERPPCRAAARSTRPTIPRAPRPRIRPTARAPALRPLRLHRLRAAPGCPRPSMSPSSRSRIVVQVVAIGKSRPHRPHRAHRSHRAHRAPPPASPSRVASAPGPWLARIAPHASLFRRMREKGPLPGNFRPKCMLFEIKMATSSPYASHFRAQSGDSGYMARESCRPGPFFASRSPKSCMARRCCQRRPAFPRQRHAVRPNGLCAMRQRHATRGMAERALRPAARAWPACRMRSPPAVLLVSAAACASPPSRPRSSPPSYTRRASPPALRPPCPAIRHAAHCGRGEPPIGLFLLSSCCQRRRIAPTDARSPAPPEPQPEPTGPRP